MNDRPELIADRRTFVSGAIASFGVRVVGTLVTLGAHMALARAMTLEGYAAYSVTLTTIAFLAIVAQGGLGQAGVRFVSEAVADRDGPRLLRFVRVSETTIMAASLVLVTGSVAASTIVPPGPVRDTLATGILLLPFVASMQMLQQVARGERQMVRAQAWEQVGVPLALCSTALFMLFRTTTLTLAVVVTVHTVVAGVACLFLFRSITRTAADFEAALKNESPPARHWFAVAAPLGAVALMTLFLTQGEVVVLGWFTDARNVGWYAAAIRITNVMVFGQYATNAIGGPMLAGLYRRREFERLQHHVTLSATYASGFSLAFIAAIILFPRQILGLFGPSFVAAAPVLVILGIGQFANAMAGPTGNLMSVTGLENAYLKVTSAFVVTKLLLLVPAIIAWGAVGAAVVTALMTIGRNAVLSWWTYRKIGVVTFPWPGVRGSSERFSLRTGLLPASEETRPKAHG